MSKYTAQTIRKWCVDRPSSSGGPWIPARAINYKFDSLISRIKWAFGVLVGRYDALDWEE